MTVSQPGPASLTLRELSTHAELLVASGGDAFVRYDIPADLTGPAFALSGAIALARRTHTRRLGLLAAGPAPDVAALVGALASQDLLAQLPLTHVTLPRDALDAVAEHLALGDGNDWEWMYAVEPPPVAPAEERVVALDDGHLDEINSLLAVANPRTDARPFAEDGQRWTGVRDTAGRLVACGVEEPNVAGYPILSGISVHPGERGTGLGLAVTAHLTRRAVRERGVCTLGMYSDNDVARRVYLGLGYRCDHLWSSRRLASASTSTHPGQAKSSGV